MSRQVVRHTRQVRLVGCRARQLLPQRHRLATVSQMATIDPTIGRAAFIFVFPGEVFDFLRFCAGNVRMLRVLGVRTANFEAVGNDDLPWSHQVRLSLHVCEVLKALESGGALGASDGSGGGGDGLARHQLHMLISQVVSFGVVV